MRLKDLDVGQARLVSTLLEEALDVPIAQRIAWLDRAGVTHGPGMAELVAELLGSHARACDAELLVHPPRALAAAFDEPAADAGLSPGMRVGPYRLVRALGAGGMAVVWLAERADGAFTRTVALKLLRSVRHRGDLPGRFDRERDILARLRHPNIALLYDAGVTSAGQAYLALEFVDGDPITAWCDARQLSVAARLRLFLQVLAAVQFAHSSLIIHRDLKPSNILVSADGQVHLLDFGIAKLLHRGSDTADETQLTGHGGRVLTLAYASPEQIRGEPLTTATDIYSLGVVLYELLAGCQPYRVKVRSAAQVEQAIVDGAWIPPSQAVSAARAPALGLRSRRAAQRVLAKDLDALAGMAMHALPRRRYVTADTLHQDVQRHLDGIPVAARRPSRALVAARFLRRHAAASSMVTTLVLIVCAATIIAINSARDERQERQRADTTRDFLRDIFSQEATENSDGARLTAAELLGRSGRRLDTQFAGDPHTKAILLTEIGAVYLSLGLHDDARPYATKATNLLEPARDRYPDDYLTAVDLLAEVLSEGDAWSEAIALADRTLGFAKAHPGGIKAWDGRLLGHRGLATRQSGRLSDALKDTSAALAAMKQAGAEGSEYYVNTLNDLGGLYLDQGRDRRALEIFQQLLQATAETSTEPKANQLVGRFKIALAYAHLGEVAHSTRIVEDVVTGLDALVGPHYDRTIKARNLLARDYSLTGRTAQALAVVDVNLDALAHRPDDDLEGLRGAELAKAQVALDAMRVPAATELAQRASDYFDRKYPAPKPIKLHAWWVLGEARLQAHDCKGARPLLEAALAGTRLNLAVQSHPVIADMLDSLARCSLLEGDLAAARAQFAEALAINRAALGAGKPSTYRSQVHLAWADALLSRKPEMLGQLAVLRVGLVDAVGSENHPDVLQLDYLADTLAVELGGRRLALARRAEVEIRLEALAGTSRAPDFVGLNSLSS